MNELQKGTYLKDGKYRIESVLGQGAFGITYLATAKLTVSENLGSMSVSVKVAIKEFFMHDINQRDEGETAITGSESATAIRYREKFRKEAENLSRMNHPNIIKVLEVFDENNTTYYAMEHIEGCSLDEYILRQGGLGETEALLKIKDIALAVSYMHKQRMLHLDIKPKNIMMDSHQQLYLIDFGLSKQYDDKGEPESSTSIGFGTPGYAPIEQANYEQNGTFPATLDVYALGATLYKMVTAETPPKASQVFEEGLDMAVLKEKGFTDSLLESISRAMSPNKKNRPQSVNDFLALLEIAEETDKSNSGNIQVSQSDEALIPIPDNGIIIKMLPSDGLALSFYFELYANKPCLVHVRKNAVIKINEQWGYGIPSDVVEYLKRNHFLDKNHWEIESDTQPETMTSGSTVVCEFTYKNGMSYVRRVENAHLTYNNVLYGAIERLVWSTSLRKWLLKSGEDPKYCEFDDVQLDVIGMQEKVYISPDTDVIEFSYVGGLIPSPYHRSYETVITKNDIKIKVYCYNDVLFDGSFPFDGYKFFSLLGLITSLDIHLLPLKENEAPGGESLHLSLQRNGETYMKVYIYGNEYCMSEGTTNANLYLIKKEIERIIPNFHSIYAQEEAFDVSNIKKETFTIKGISFNMVYVEGGTFKMGNESVIANDDERPIHNETIKDFFIGEMQVTQSLWEVVMGENPSTQKMSNGPVENISWYECNDFVQALNNITGRKFRLPTESEWEYAARGGNRGQDFIYSGSNRPELVGWYLDVSNNGIHEVGQKFPNELGLYDMSGNVYEWCNNKYANYRKGIKSFITNFKEKERVIRGGSWREWPKRSRVTARYSTSPENKAEDLGLRLAMSV